MIGIVKLCLRKVVGRALLIFEELAIVMTEVVNNRPLIYLSRDLNENDALCPLCSMVEDIEHTLIQSTFLI